MKLLETVEHWIVQDQKMRTRGHHKQYTLAIAVRFGVGESKARALIQDGKMPNHQNGCLAPQWTEWLMMWPIGWTDLRPLEMDRFRQWSDLHGKR